jgi:hypothetical protein
LPPEPNAICTASTPISRYIAPRATSPPRASHCSQRLDAASRPAALAV